MTNPIVQRKFFTIIYVKEFGLAMAKNMPPQLEQKEDLHK